MTHFVCVWPTDHWKAYSSGLIVICHWGKFRNHGITFLKNVLFFCWLVIRRKVSNAQRLSLSERQ